MQSNASLAIYSVCSEGYRDVYSVFRKSLEDIGYPAEQIITKFYDDSDFDAKGFQTPSWYFAIQEKLRFVLSQVRTHPGKFIISSDVDIQFFPPFLEADLGQLMNARNLDLLFMRELSNEVPPVNAGFIVIRCTEEVARLLESISGRIAEEQLPFADQTAFSEALRSGAHEVRFDTIDTDKVIWGLAAPPVISDAWFHHAVCCRTNAEKLNQFEAIRTIRAAHQRKISSVLRSLARRIFTRNREADFRGRAVQ
ncbi:putative nucleotide-diphospho-sugar transferase [Holophaga foetida]|uniref:putative nucleotide-diphospho-sugar transferase n=1 Tax=Holophaga foetida TaxID=35839 RepID=UPI0002472ACB|nr:putative nucleotide-diphospho-sugar transferase [Holophaga foetida]